MRPRSLQRFFEEAQHIITYFLQHHSSSIGIGDTIASEETLDVITTTIRTARREVTKLVDLARNSEKGGLKRQPGITLVETFEQKVNEVLNKSLNTAGKAVKKTLKKDNNIKQMGECDQHFSDHRVCWAAERSRYGRFVVCETELISFADNFEFLSASSRQCLIIRALSGALEASVCLFPTGHILPQ